MTPYFQTELGLLYQGDVLDILRQLSNKSVQMCVTSPPYWGLRDYGTAKWEGGDENCKHIGMESRCISGGQGKQYTNEGSNRVFSGDCICGAKRIDNQIGLEKTPEEYVAKMVEVFREVRRVLRDDGVCFINLGDSYMGSGGPGSQYDNKAIGQYKEGFHKYKNPNRKVMNGLKPKDLCGIPWRVAFALQQPYRVSSCVKSEVDKAWLAAMFDGEGCIGIRRFDSYRKEKQQVYQDGFVVYTVVTNSDIELLDRCVEITGIGKVRPKQRAGDTDGRGIVSRRDSYGWRPEGNAAIKVIRSIYSHLIAKRKQACIAFTLDLLNKNGHGSRSVPKDVQEKKTYLWGLIKACNQRRPVDLPDWIQEPKEEIEPGWYLRSDIIWHKPNPMPESVTDRPTKSHEYLFLLSKQAKYYYDAEAIREPLSESTLADSRNATGRHTQGDKHGTKYDEWESKQKPSWYRAKVFVNPMNGRNKRSVWTIATHPFPGSHFAVFPEKLIEPCILAGTSEKGCCPDCGKPWERVVEKGELIGKDRGGNYKGRNIDRLVHTNPGKPGMSYETKTTNWQPTCSCGKEPIPCVVLDIFFGAGTTGLVCEKLNRRWIGIELSEAYCKIAAKRIDNATKQRRLFE